jgi:outer membrane protein TolC
VAAREAVAVQMKARLDASQATALDEAMAAVTAAEAVEDRVDLAARRGAARAALFVQLGLPADADVRVTGAPPDAWPPPPLPDERALVEAALRTRPEIATAAARVEATGARAFAERVKRLPWLSFVEVGYEVGPGIPDGQGFTLQAGIDLPTFDLNRKGVIAAESAQTAAKLGFVAAVQGVSREVSVRLQAARVAEGQVTELKKIVQPASQRASAAIQQAVQGHDVDVVLALMVDVRRVRVELLYLDAIRRYRTAVSDLRRSLGGQLPSKSAPAPGETAK